MQIIILPEIFGRTSFITALETQFLDREFAVQTLDPYGGKQPVFDNEQHAYDHFMNECGYDGYLNLLQRMINETEGPVFLMGFSVGASTAWRILGNVAYANKVKRFVGFYPGQIRHYLSVYPICPATLIFPKTETHFSVQDVMKSVAEKDSVTCYQSDAGHGFLNPNSVNFVPELSTKFLDAFKGSNPENIDTVLDSYFLTSFQEPVCG
ncbi:dienelactone hydrolase family protein [Kiloniella sp.]|uniref:dienelactone hydrolase family protein n=1 Tax=Kiloniella sp. TaxID=1938587 RepID=UPI003A9091AC